MRKFWMFEHIKFEPTRTWLGNPIQIDNLFARLCLWWQALNRWTVSESIAVDAFYAFDTIWKLQGWSLALSRSKEAWEVLSYTLRIREQHHWLFVQSQRSRVAKASRSLSNLTKRTSIILNFAFGRFWKFYSPSKDLSWQTFSGSGIKIQLVRFMKLASSRLNTKYLLS